VDFGDKGYTSVFVAAEKSHVEVVHELLNHGTIVDFANKEGRTSLHFSGKESHLDIVGSC
jgi:ankyrin repeat protein